MADFPPAIRGPGDEFKLEPLRQQNQAVEAPRVTDDLGHPLYEHQLPIKSGRDLKYQAKERQHFATPKKVLYKTSDGREYFDLEYPRERPPPDQVLPLGYSERPHPASDAYNRCAWFATKYNHMNGYAYPAQWHTHYLYPPSKASPKEPSPSQTYRPRSPDRRHRRSLSHHSKHRSRSRSRKTKAAQTALSQRDLKADIVKAAMRSYDEARWLQEPNVVSTVAAYDTLLAQQRADRQDTMRSEWVPVAGAAMPSEPSEVISSMFNADGDTHESKPSHIAFSQDTSTTPPPGDTKLSFLESRLRSEDVTSSSALNDLRKDQDRDKVNRPPAHKGAAPKKATLVQESKHDPSPSEINEALDKPVKEFLDALRSVSPGSAPLTAMSAPEVKPARIVPPQAPHGGMKSQQSSAPPAKSVHLNKTPPLDISKAAEAEHTSATPLRLGGTHRFHTPALQSTHTVDSSVHFLDKSLTLRPTANFPETGSSKADDTSSEGSEFLPPTGKVQNAMAAFGVSDVATLDDKLKNLRGAPTLADSEFPKPSSSTLASKVTDDTFWGPKKSKSHIPGSSSLDPYKLGLLNDESSSELSKRQRERHNYLKKQLESDSFEKLVEAQEEKKQLSARGSQQMSRDLLVKTTPGDRRRLQADDLSDRKRLSSSEHGSMRRRLSAESGINAMGGRTLIDSEESSSSSRRGRL